MFLAFAASKPFCYLISGCFSPSRYETQFPESVSALSIHKAMGCLYRYFRCSAHLMPTDLHHIAQSVGFSVCYYDALCCGVHLRCTCVALALHVHCTLNLHCICAVPALHPASASCICTAPELHLCCTCTAPVLHLLFTCSTPVLCQSVPHWCYISLCLLYGCSFVLSCIS